MSTKKKRRVSGEGSGKQTTIKDAFSKQQQKNSLPSLQDELETQVQPKLVPEVFLEEVLKVYEMYKEQQGATSRAIARNSGLRRSSRQRTQTRKFSIEGADAPAAEAAAAAQKPRAASHDDEDEDEDVGGSGGGSEHEDGKENARGDMQADEEERQYEVNQLVCANWQKNASWFINQVASWVSPNWMLPLNIQECLVHFVANHEMHTTDPSLSIRALTLLQKVASYHPHTLFLPADDDLPARIASHDELWHPLVKDSTITGRMGATGFQLLQRLVSAALDIATGAPEGAGGSGGGAGLSTSSGEGSGQQVGRQGRALLLHHVAHVLQLDLAARLRVWRAARQQDDGGARAAETVLQSALLWRLLQDDNSWLGIQGDKVQLVRNLAQLAVAGRAEVAGASNARQQQQQQGSHDAGQLPLPSMLRLESLRALGARLLRLLLALLDAAEDAGLYSESARQRIRAQGCNDRMQVDKALLGVLLGNDVPTVLKHPLTKGDLLSVLPGRDRVRLLAMLVAGAYSKSWNDKHPCDHLEQLYVYQDDKGKGAMALVEGDVEVVASYLATHYHWAAKALAAGSLDGCTMFAAHLILGAVEAAHAQSVAATAKAAPAALARQQAARGKGRRGAAVANAGGASSGDAGAGEAAAAAFPFAAVRKLIAAARGVDGFAGLHVEVKETLVLAEVAVRRLAPAVGEVGGEGEAE